MKTKLLIAAACAATLAAPAFAGGSGAHEAKTSANAATAPAAATPADTEITTGAGASVEAVKPSVEIVSRGADGRPDVVSVDGQTYNVCKTEDQDSCINPRSAGLNFGARDLQYWPGRPASEIDTPLPATPPAVQP